ncbi:MAG: amidohydrolase [Anaerolineae bacterium]|nr:amidohydrolase [Anaerolineae bacterium]
MIYADAILSRARLYTVDDAQPWAEAVAVREGRIVAVGDAREMDDLRGPQTEVYDLGGRLVLPAFSDAHIHFVWWALQRRQVDVTDVPTPQEAAARVAARAQTLPAGAWVRGGGFNRNLWPGSEWPTKDLLDATAPRNPVALDSKDGHSLWVNSRALALAGITASTPDPMGGVIRRDARGEPTGILNENAVPLVFNAIPPESEEECIAAVREGIPLAWAAGITAIHEANDTPEARSFRTFQALDRAGELGLRVLQHIPVANLGHALSVGLRSGFGHDRLRIGGIKIFADGALGSRTADMLEPYVGEPDNWGVAVVDKEELLEVVSRAAAGGLLVTVHAIGDRANRHVLDVLAEVRKQEREQGDAPLRHRVEHVQIAHPDDLPRLARLDVIASVQPLHATSDMVMADRHWGEPRVRGAYAYASLSASGARLAFGSDAPIEPFAPLLGIHAAVTRRRADGRPGPSGWHPEQRLRVEDVVRAYTWGAAYAAGEERARGSITAGKVADFVILSQDIFECRPMDILQTQIEATFFAGRLVHGKV